MTKIDYEVKYYKKTITTTQLFDDFFNFDLVQGYCKECPRYNTNYSCSPLDIDVKEFIHSFDYIDIIVTQLRFKPEDYEKEYSSDELKELLFDTFYKEKEKTCERVLASEKNYPKAESITGPCNDCVENCREVYDECQHPEIRRYSLASLGLDSKKILKDLFDIELLLINGKLPKYLNNISSILYSKKV